VNCVFKGSIISYKAHNTKNVNSHFQARPKMWKNQLQITHTLTMAKISTLHPFVDIIKEPTCNAGWQQTVYETRKLFREHLQLLHSSADPIHQESHVQSRPMGSDCRASGWKRRLYARQEYLASFSEAASYYYYYHYCCAFIALFYCI